MGYALVTPARDEAENLRRLAACVVAQTVRPEAWIVVDNGSVDETREVVRALERDYPWVSLLESPPTSSAKPGLPVVRAFHVGVEALARPVGVVVKLDADVSFKADYFESLLTAFAADPTLGIASGACFERRDDVWRVTHVTEAHVRGATRAYRWECLQEILPLEERVGWDGIDELKANVRGWRTAIVHDLPFRHHRFVGERDGTPTARWLQLGHATYYMGYRPSYLALRVLHRARNDPAALAMAWGYVVAAVRREPRNPDEDVRRYLRDRQRLRRLPQRRREALGKRPS